MENFKPFYKRYLPHIQNKGAILCLTYRLAGSLPAEVLQKLRDERALEEQGLNHSSYDEQKELESFGK